MAVFSCLAESAAVAAFGVGGSGGSGRFHCVVLVMLFW